MPVPLPDDFVLTPTVGTIWGGRIVQGGVPAVRVALDETRAAVVDALLTGCPVGRAGCDAGLVARRLVELDLAVAAPSGSVGDPSVTVVIPAHDAAATLPSTLRSLDPSIPVVVVDDGSHDDTAQVATLHGARVLRHERAEGPSAARNAGAEVVETELIAFIDADAEPPPGWLRVLAAHLSDEELGGAAPRVVAAGGSGLVSRLEAGGGVLDLGPAPGLVGPDGRVPFASSTALLMRGRHFRQLGGFDASLRFGEDLDLVWRLARAGHPVRYVPDVVVQHRSRERLGTHLRNVSRYASAAAPLDRRHGRPRPCRATPLVALAVGSVLLGFRRAGAGIGALAVLDACRRPAGACASTSVATGDGSASIARSLLRQARGVLAAVSRPWLPFAATAAGTLPRARTGVAVALTARWAARARRRGVLTLDRLLLEVLEDAAASVGVIAGCARHGRTGPLVPLSPDRQTVRHSLLGEECLLS